MFVIAAILGLLTISSLTHGQSRDCTSEADQGNTCGTSQPVLRYYYDKTIEACLPFLYKGCGGNKNNYVTSLACSSRCVKLDLFGCSLGKPSTGICNNKGLTCPAGSVCHYGAFNSGVCCDSKTEAQIEKEWRPKCDGGKTLTKRLTSAGLRPLIGRKCSHEFCPAGAKCVQGKYLAHCCE